MSGRALPLVFSLMVLAEWPAFCGEAALPWSSDMQAELKAAAADGKPVLVVICKPLDAGSIDVGHWLTDDPTLNPLLEKFHRVMVWNERFEQGERGLFVLTSKGAMLSTEGIPELREQLKGRLERALAYPESYGEVAAKAEAKLGDAALCDRAVEVLRGVNNADWALRLVRAQLASKPDAERTKVLKAQEEELELQALPDLARRLENVAGVIERSQGAKDFSQLPAPAVAEPLLLSLIGAYSGNEARDKDLQKTFAEFLTALREGFKANDAAALKTLLAKGEALRPTIVAWGKALVEESRAHNKAFIEANPKHLKALLARVQASAGPAVRDPKAEEELAAAVRELVALKMTRDERLRTIGLTMHGVLTLEMADQIEPLFEKLKQESPKGRDSADALLDLADMAAARGKLALALELITAAEHASADLESPTYLSAARAMRPLLDGTASPRRTRWAQRKVLDVLVLVQDIDGYMSALSAWSEERFFPILFADDLYAPKFVDAFKPARVLLVPKSNAKEAVPSQDEMRLALALAWSAPGKNEKPAPTREALLARLQALKEAPQGVVYAAPGAEEGLGGLALAAGRFEGLEFLDVPKVDHPPQERVAKVEDYLTSEAARALNQKVLEGLGTWGLPRDGQWAAITLCGPYPFRYNGPNLRSGGTTYAVDDLLGRTNDTLRVAAVGRLNGGKERSVYQAMCSLFLMPENAFLFNTYGGNIKSDWGKYTLQAAELFVKERFKYEYLGAEQTDVDAFRARTFPWNRNDLLLINSSGYPDRWSLKGGEGTTEDFPIGEPTVIHITHSGSAAEPYDPETLAGRAIWGGAYWYFGSTTEPFLTAFQKPSYYAPRILAGAPFSATFRQRPGVGFWHPWRLMIFGDPLFCLREKPAPREAAPAGKALVREGEQVLRGEGAGNAAPVDADPNRTWLALLRTARWTGDRDAAQKLAAFGKPMDGEGLALALEEDLRAGEVVRAVARWKAADAESKKNYPAKIYARQAAGVVMDKAAAAKDLAALQTSLDDLLTTGPANNFIAHWLERIEALAKEQNRDADADALLAKLAQNEALKNYKATVEERIKTRRVTGLYAKAQWTKEDLDYAYANFWERVKSAEDGRELRQPLQQLAQAAVEKQEKYRLEDVVLALDGRATPGSPEDKKLRPLLKDLRVQHSYFKDWAVLGPFVDQAVAVPEKILAGGKPDFGATYADKDAKRTWTRPFNARAFGTIDLAALLKPNENVCAYAAAEMECAKDKEGTLLFGSDDGITVWLDGQQIHRNPTERGVKPDEDKVPVKLSAGKHLLVVRIDQGTGGWGFCARIADKGGEAILPGITWRCPLGEAAVATQIPTPVPTPAPTPAPVAVPTGSELLVEATSDGHLTLNGEKIASAALTEKVVEALKANPQLKITLHKQPKTSDETMNTAIQALRKAQVPSFTVDEN